MLNAISDPNAFGDDPPVMELSGIAYGPVITVTGFVMFDANTVLIQPIEFVA